MPFRDQEERFVVRFNPTTHLIEWQESMRYKASSSAAKTLWLNHSRSTEVRDRHSYPPVGEVIWMDNGKPWFILTVENALYNAELSEYIRATGP